MADVLNRTTKRFLPSVNTPDYPVADWIRNPDLAAVTGFAPKYWTISGDDVLLMSQAERDAVDAAELADARDALADQLDQVEDLLRAVVLITFDEVNALRALHGLPPRTIAQLKAAVRNKLGS